MVNDSFAQHHSHGAICDKQLRSLFQVLVLDVHDEGVQREGFPLHRHFDVHLFLLVEQELQASTARCVRKSLGCLVRRRSPRLTESHLNSIDSEMDFVLGASVAAVAGSGCVSLPAPALGGALPSLAMSRQWSDGRAACAMMWTRATLSKMGRGVG